MRGETFTQHPPGPGGPCARHRDKGVCRSCLARYLLREQLGREQPFEKVVVPELPSRRAGPSHAHDGGCLEHGARGVLRRPEPVLRRASLALEVGEEVTLRADPFGPRSAIAAFSARDSCWNRALAAHRRDGTRGTRPSGRTTAPVRRLEDLAAFVEHVAPGGRSRQRARAAEIVVTAHDRDRKSDSIEPSSGRPRAPRRGPTARDRAGAKKFRATRKRRACSAVTSPAGH